MSCNCISLTAVTSLTFELPYFTHINRSRRRHEKDLEFYALLCWRNWNSLCLHLCPRSFPLCCRAWRLSPLEKRNNRSRSRFREVPTWREGIFLLVFRINKDVMSFFFPNHCSMCDWISVSDHMMMLFRSFVHVYLIIIVLYVVIMAWGRYNLFCRSLGARGARRGWKRKLGPAFS